MPAGGQITVTDLHLRHQRCTGRAARHHGNTQVQRRCLCHAGQPGCSPSLGSGVYRLVWTGGLAAQYHDCLAGQAVSLTVTTTEPALSFRILFDSSTYPSRIDLPTTTVIQAMPGRDLRRALSGRS
jgi:hypothetical protein